MPANVPVMVMMFILKASLLHEFSGKRDLHLRSANGEVMDVSNDYGDTWFELGLGTNISLSKTAILWRY